MNHRISLIAMLAISATACSTPGPVPVAPPAPPTAPTAAAPIDARVLLGNWAVDLRPTPDAAPYLQALVVSSVTGNTFQGQFYGTAITDGRINTAWGAVRIAFVTADGSGSYHHSAVLAGSRLDGLTNSPGRGFLAYWSAVKP